MAWELTGNIAGPDGPPGADGEPGDQGIQGEPGADGADGADGVGGVQKYAQLLGATNPVTVTHGLGTYDVVVMVYAAGNVVVQADVDCTSEDTIDISFAQTPDEDYFRVVVIG